MENEQHEARWHIGSTEKEVHDLRREVAQTLGGWNLLLDADLTFTFLLLVSELATNAYRYGRCSMITVALVATPGELFIDVMDGRNTSLPLRPRLRTSPRAESGRGLQLVAAFANAWGEHRTRHGKGVWATLSVPGAPEPPTLPTKRPSAVASRYAHLPGLSVDVAT